MGAADKDRGARSAHASDERRKSTHDPDHVREGPGAVRPNGPGRRFERMRHRVDELEADLLDAFPPGGGSDSPDSDDDWVE